MPRFHLLAPLVLFGFILTGCGKIEGDGGDTGRTNNGDGGGGGDGGGPGGGGDGGGDDTGGDDTGGDDTGGGDGGPGGGGDGDGDGGDSGGDGGADTVTVSQIQQGDVSKGDDVQLSGVIATSGLDADGDGFFIQDAGGGAWSGVYAYVYDKRASEIGVEVGKSYDIGGYVDEFYGLTELVISDPAQVVENAGPAGEPTADGVNPDSIADWELWEGCLVNLGAVTVSAVDEYGQGTIDGGLLLDNGFFDFDISAGDEISELVGVVTYAYDLWRIYPRSEDDLSPDVSTPPTGPAVADIQTGVYVDGDTVTVEGVVATSELTLNGDGFWVQDAGGGGWSGVFVYLYAGAGGLSISVGDELTITGEVQEYYDMTELFVLDPSDITETGTASVTTSSVDPGTVSDWEEWEGCLIEVGAATALGAPNKYGQTELDIGLYLDDALYDYTFGVSIGSSWSNLRGLLGYTFSDWVLYPHDASDLSR